MKNYNNMKVTINKQNEKTLVVLDGRIDSTNADQFQHDIAPLMEGDNPAHHEDIH